MAGSNNTGSRFSISLMLGMLLIPVSAVVAVALVSPGEGVDGISPESLKAVNVSDLTTQQTIIVEPVTVSEDQLGAACGVDGLFLVSLEDDGTISDVQKAALDALRQLCFEEGMALPDPTAPPPITRTEVREVVAAPEHASDESHDDEKGQDEHEDDDDYEDESHASESDYQAAHAAAEDAISEAIAAGGSGEDIAEAQHKLAEAEKKAQHHKWDEAVKKSNEARRKAGEALHGDDD